MLTSYLDSSSRGEANFTLVSIGSGTDSPPSWVAHASILSRATDIRPNLDAVATGQAAARGSGLQFVVRPRWRWTVGPIRRVADGPAVEVAHDPLGQSRPTATS